MARKRVTTMMLSNLPHDLELEILSWVPSKSLAKLQTTCKRWYHLFKDQNFVAKNLCKEEKEEEELILLMKSGVYSVRFNLHGIQESVDPSIEFTGKLRSRLNVSKDLEISQIFHCDGLVLCSRKSSTRLVVLNPCTGGTRKIEPRICYHREDIYAIGYGKSNPCCRSYKVLRFCCYEDDQNRAVADEFEMYEFSSDSWRVLDGFADKWCSFSHTYLCPGVSLKGNTYWVAAVEKAGYAHTLLGFDFTTESFRYLPLPYQNNNEEDGIALSVIRGEQLALLHENFNTHHSPKLSIWLSNKIDEEAKEVTWSKFLEVDLIDFMLPFLSTLTAFMVEEEKKVAVFCTSPVLDGYRSSVFVVGEDKHKLVYKENTEGSSSSWPALLTYAPSLVRIK